MYSFHSAFCFYNNKSPISYGFKYRYKSASSAIPDEISIGKVDFFNDLDGYIFADNYLQKIGAVELPDLWKAESIDMGIYNSLRYWIMNFGDMMNCHLEKYSMSRGRGNDSELLSLVDGTRCTLLNHLIKTNDPKLATLLKGSKDWSGIFFDTHNHILFGNQIKVDDSIRPVIHAWVMLVFWIDSRYKKENSSFVITPKDECDWKEFSSQFDASQLISGA